MTATSRGPGRALRAGASRLRIGLVVLAFLVFVAGDPRRAEAQDDKKPDATDTVVVKRDRLRAMEEELARLRGLLAGKAPSRCVLKGKVERNLVVLEVRFAFATETSPAVVSLGCGLANITGAALDGRVPILLSGRALGGEPEGFSVVVEKAGPHQLTLDLVLPIVARPPAAGGGHGFVLDLPRAASTELEALELPGGIKDVRSGNRALADLPLFELKGNRVSAPALGVADKFELNWKSAQAAGPAPMATAEGVVQVRIASPNGAPGPGGRVLSTDARLTLKSLGGMVSQWRLVVPTKAVVEAVGADAGRIHPIEGIEQKGVRLVTVRLKEPSDAPFTVRVSSQVPLPANGRMPVGPFTVLGADRQGGNVLVSNGTTDMHLNYVLSPQGDLVRRALTDDEQRRDIVAAFRYGHVARSGDRATTGSGDRATTGSGDRATTGDRGSSPWLEVEAETMRGQVRARVTHTLTPMSAFARGEAPRWRLTTTVVGKPRWSDVARLQVRLPPGWEYVDEGRLAREGVGNVTYEPEKRLVVVPLTRGAGGPGLKTFKVAFEAISQPAERPPVAPAARALDIQRVELALPRPENTIDEGGEVTVEAPPDIELLADTIAAQATGLTLTRQKHNQLVWTSERRAPDSVEVRWRRWRPEVRVTALVDLVLTGPPGVGEGQVARHELLYRFPNSVPSQISLRVPAEVGPGLRVVEGGRAAVAHAKDGPGARTWVVHLTAPPGEKEKGPRSGDRGPTGGPGDRGLTGGPGDRGLTGGQERRLVLEYAFPLRQNVASDRFDIPLVTPAPDEGAWFQGETKVRVWAEPGALPSAVGTHWSERNIEEVPGTNRLPALVVRSEKVDQPLALRLSEPANGATACSFLVSRALIQATVDEGGVQTYRARYLLTRLAGRRLDVELPAPISALGVTIRLDGKSVTWETVNREGQRDDGGHVARLRPALSQQRQRTVLEVSYQLSSGRTSAGPLQTTLLAPVLYGHPGQRSAEPTRALGGALRWQVSLPTSWVVLGPEAGPVAQFSWTRRGWLLAPRLRLPASVVDDWERSFAIAGEDAGPFSNDGPERLDLVSGSDGENSLTITHVPQQAWLLICSLLLLVCSLGLVWGTAGASGQGRWAWLWLARGLLVVGVGVLVVGALLRPTICSQVAYGCQPGAVVCSLVFLVQWLVQERYRRQIVFLHNFSRPRGGSSLLRARAAGEAPNDGAAGRGPGEPSTVDAVPRPE